MIPTMNAEAKNILHSLIGFTVNKKGKKHQLGFTNLEVLTSSGVLVGATSLLFSAFGANSDMMHEIKIKSVTAHVKSIAKAVRLQKKYTGAYTYNIDGLVSEEKFNGRNNNSRDIDIYKNGSYNLHWAGPYISEDGVYGDNENSKIKLDNIKEGLTGSIKVIKNKKNVKNLFYVLDGLSEYRKNDKKLFAKIYSQCSGGKIFNKDLERKLNVAKGECGYIQEDDHLKIAYMVETV